MKTNSSFPHPVLGINKGVLPDLGEDALEVVKIEEKEDSYVYTFRMKQENAQISQYITDNLAQYICEVDCSKSFYKKTHSSTSPTIVVPIKKTDVVGHIDFSFFVVTTIGYNNYCNNGFNPDYKDPVNGTMPSFVLEKGAVLVVFPQWSDDVNIRFNNKPDLNAFIQIVKRKDTEKSVNIDLGDDIINIELPEDMYYSFLEYNHDQYRGLFYTSIIFNALVKAILNINDGEGLVWADSIQALMEAMPDKYQGLSLDDPTDAVDIATAMLSNSEYGSPYDLLFSSIKNLQN
jgi:hypothetical protein